MFLDILAHLLALAGTIALSSVLLAVALAALTGAAFLIRLWWRS
ncbi:hypothetical protein SEA_FIREMAN_6 [Microbacterium phage Fireman]|uniref:Uncharacterized protein n=1 Tax=Microbacterium phage Fireman TaxID=2530118 RepID=A0A481VWE4_9CAUD|nr:hypothetical protein HOV22_gp07 [Microbacterium phage Fireman]QBI98090.1 hypothetical protein SEA_FIREMAN_6 [Microbacterium phage Fireman]